MPKTALEQWDETNANNSDIGGTNIAENCAPSGINNAIREEMAQVAAWLGDDTLASAATTDLGSVPGRYVSVTGTTTITAFGTIKAGTIKYVKFSGALTLTHNATSLILPGAANITTAAGDTAIMVSEGSGNWRCVSYQRASGMVSRVVQQTFSGSGTYTPTAGMLYCIVEAVGGGGGSGGAKSSVGTACGSGGGGGGGYSRSVLTAAQIGTSQTVTIGAAGAAGAATPTNGGAGGDTSLGSLVIAKGGSGSSSASTSSGSSGGAGGVVGTGTIAAAGGGGGAGFGASISSVGPTSGAGGDSLLGGGARGQIANGTSAVPGIAPAGYGSGAAGAIEYNQAVGAAGAAGASGFLIITEYCK